MFRSLRTNQQFFVLTKGANPRLDVGFVVSVSTPQLKFPMPTPLGQQQGEYVVDVVINLNGAQQTFQKLPADKEIADFGESFGNIIVSASRDAMNSELANLKTSSEEHLRRVDEERAKIIAYEAILQQLNPEYAEKQKQEQKIQNLENQMAQMMQTNNNLENMLSQLMARLDSEGSKSKPKNN